MKLAPFYSGKTLGILPLVLTVHQLSAVSEKKVKSQVFQFSLFSMSCGKGDRLSQSRPGYKVVVLVLPTCLFTVFILLFIYYYYFSNPHSLHPTKLMLDT